VSVRIQIKKNQDTVSRLLQDLTGRLQDLTPVMRDIGEILVEHIQENFREGTAPDGTRWKPSVRAMKEGGKTLIDTGVLRNSFHARPDRRSVRIGTPDVRAAVHQFGAPLPRIPSSPYGRGVAGRRGFRFSPETSGTGQGHGHVPGNVARRNWEAESRIG
jgi:phage gpG-like protein